MKIQTLKTTLILLFSIATTCSWSQNAKDPYMGYLLLNSGDSLYGRFKSDVNYFNHLDEVSFLKKGSRTYQKYVPDQLKKAVILDHIYLVTANISYDVKYLMDPEKIHKNGVRDSIITERVFLENLVDGVYKLYLYKSNWNTQGFYVQDALNNYHALTNKASFIKGSSGEGHKSGAYKNILYILFNSCDGLDNESAYKYKFTPGSLVRALAALNDCHGGVYINRISKEKINYSFAFGGGMNIAQNKLAFSRLNHLALSPHIGVGYYLSASLFLTNERWLNGSAIKMDIQYNYLKNTETGLTNGWRRKMTAFYNPKMLEARLGINWKAFKKIPQLGINPSLRYGIVLNSDTAFYRQQEIRFQNDKPYSNYINDDTFMHSLGTGLNLNYLIPFKRGRQILINTGVGTSIYKLHHAEIMFKAWYYELGIQFYLD